MRRPAVQSNKQVGRTYRHATCHFLDPRTCFELGSSNTIYVYTACCQECSYARHSWRNYSPGIAHAICVYLAYFRSDFTNRCALRRSEEQINFCVFFKVVQRSTVLDSQNIYSCKNAMLSFFGLS